MKSTGMVRKVDELGRVVIPIELRRNLGIEEKDPMEIFMDIDKIILKKYTPEMACAVTGKVTEDNCRFLSGRLTLSPEGAEKLIREVLLKMDIKI